MRRIPLIFMTALALSAPVLADTIVLNNGKTMEGTFIGREGDNVKFDADGITMTFNASDVKTINMGSAAPAAKPVEEAAAAPKSQPAKVASVPAGTPLTISLQQNLDSGRHTQGHKFTAKLEGALVADGTTVAPAGSVVYGMVTEAKKSRRVAGQASLIITITGINLNGQIVPITTNSINALTAPTGASSAGKVVRGAAIGGLIDGSDGAKTGAKVGAGAAILSRGNQVVIPPGTLLDFQLTQELSGS